MAGSQGPVTGRGNDTPTRSGALSTAPGQTWTLAKRTPRAAEDPTVDVPAIALTGLLGPIAGFLSSPHQVPALWPASGPDEEDWLGDRNTPKAAPPSPLSPSWA
ncbi:hypothetical protein ACFXO2_42385, partial [Streptomyces sp. NPDC059152]|uniref:hypothetical protein n=1 Tax=Streptomyces sp. NPDC059152 TaxID=3346742 RepID=UPI0036A8EA7B